MAERLEHLSQNSSSAALSFPNPVDDLAVGFIGSPNGLNHPELICEYERTPFLGFRLLKGPNPHFEERCSCTSISWSGSVPIASMHCSPSYPSTSSRTCTSSTALHSPCIPYRAPAAPFRRCNSVSASYRQHVSKSWAKQGCKARTTSRRLILLCKAEATEVIQSQSQYFLPSCHLEQYKDKAVFKVGILGNMRVALSTCDCCRLIALILRGQTPFLHAAE